MSEARNNTNNVSLRLSQVLNEIGLNERIVIKRRRGRLLNESLLSFTLRLIGKKANAYFFGSQSESTTTFGLQSDTDVLLSLNEYNVIQDWSEWEPNKNNLLMIQDESVSPGYCLLQMLRNDAPLPVQAIYQAYDTTYVDKEGRVLVENTLVDRHHGKIPLQRHGPARTMQSRHVTDNDLVLALPCLSWPIQSRQWLDQQDEGHWPTGYMKKYCKDTGCFVVGVGNNGSGNEILEWRISTSLAERCCMFSLNITQIRCYVLMKMVIKTFISTHCPDIISSFMCKTILLHCISNTRIYVWKENNLLNCLTLCLSNLYNCVLNEYCPHYMLPNNNLMARRFSPETKRFVLEIISYIIRSNGSALLEIEIDDLGFRIKNSFLRVVEICPEHVSKLLSGYNLTSHAVIIHDIYSSILTKTNTFEHVHLSLNMLFKCLAKLLQRFTENRDLDVKTLTVLSKRLSTTLGSVIASTNLSCQRDLAKESLILMSNGLDSDVVSGKLKLASMFYCMGDLKSTELILKHVEESYDLSVVEPICNCCNFKIMPTRERFNQLCYEVDDENTLLKQITAPCLMFLRCEINCCPYELQHEMFRSTQQDLLCRSELDNWMDMAVIDSLPYLYFLQFKTYSQLRRNEEIQRSLYNLTRCILEEPNLGHRETALNLLGQCMEQEQRINMAVKFYMLSLKLRERNNAAKLHICRLINSLINNHV